MRLLLHACCGPCSLEPVRLLKERGIKVTLAYFNPNIHPMDEYKRRWATLEQWAAQESIPVLSFPYNPQAWFDSVPTEGVEQQDRCRACYRLRLEQTAFFASRHGYDAIGTTLSVSPYQFTDIIRQELEAAAAKYGVQAFFEDYRPYYPQATSRSRAYGMYRQNYCGCAFSKIEAQQERNERKASKLAAQQEVERSNQEMENRVASYAQSGLSTDDFDYDLPQELIAQAPAYPRDSCRLLVLGREDGSISHEVFSQIIDHIQPGDLLVANETRVMPARLNGRKADTGGAVEMLLLREKAPGLWECLVKPGRRLRPGAQVEFVATDGPLAGTDQVVLKAQVKEMAGGAGERLVRFEPVDMDLDTAFHAVGKVPLPPYITQYSGDPEMYQTVFSQGEHSAAAPTAGLHFTPELIERIKQKGARFETVELEVGVDTFRIVTENDPTKHHIHTERYHVPQRVVDAIHETHATGGRVIAVGTTSVRSLESAWDEDLEDIRARVGENTSLFILPGYTYHVVDALITNFHVPRSTLMMLVSAFAGREHIMNAYHEAIEQRYRMLSFGDAMLIE